MGITKCIRCGSEHIEVYEEDNQYYCKKCLQMYSFDDRAEYYKALITDNLRIIGIPESTLEFMLSTIFLLLYELVSDEDMAATIKDMIEKGQAKQLEKLNMDETKQ